MRTIFSFLIILIISAGLFAQTQKGSMLIGGTLGFGNARTEGINYLSIKAAPSAGFFLSQRFVLGASLDISLLTSNGFYLGGFGFLPTARYYFDKSGDIRLFAQTSFGIQAIKTSDGLGYNAMVFDLGIGADFFLNQFVAIEFYMGYRRLKYLATNLPLESKHVNRLNLNFGVAAFVNRPKSASKPK